MDAKGYSYFRTKLYMYIPDFIITFPDDNELLVEIKSIVNVWNKDKEYTIHANKIIRSGWTKDFVILGSNYKAINGLIKIGLLHMNSKKYDAFLHLKNEQWCLYGETQHDESIHEKFGNIWITTKNMVQWKGPSNINNANYLNTRQCNKKVEQLQHQINELNKRL